MRIFAVFLFKKYFFTIKIKTPTSKPVTVKKPAGRLQKSYLFICV